MKQAVLEERVGPRPHGGLSVGQERDPWSRWEKQKREGKLTGCG